MFPLSAVVFLPIKNRKEKATAANRGYLRNYPLFCIPRHRDWANIVDKRWLLKAENRKQKVESRKQKAESKSEKSKKALRLRAIARFWLKPAFLFKQTNGLKPVPIHPALRTLTEGQ